MLNLGRAVDPDPTTATSAFAEPIHCANGIGVKAVANLERLDDISALAFLLGPRQMSYPSTSRHNIMTQI